MYEKRIRVALSGADVVGVEYVPGGVASEVLVEVVQTHIDYRSDGGGIEPEVVWPIPESNDPPRVARLKTFIDEFGEGRQEDMQLDLADPARYLLVQSSGHEPWYTLLPEASGAISYIESEEEPWDFETLVDLDTGEEFDLHTSYKLVLRTNRKART